MQTVPHTKKILFKSYSVWFGSYLQLLWLLVPELLYKYFEIELSYLFVFIVAAIIATLQPFLRIIPQKGISE